MFFVEMLVMHFVCSSDSSQIPVIAVAENFKALMNKDIMYQKVTQSVYGNSNSNKKPNIVSIQNSEKYQKETGNSEYQKECIISFERILCDPDGGHDARSIKDHA
jgi:hypothetical protein